MEGLVAGWQRGPIAGAGRAVRWVIALVVLSALVLLLAFGAVVGAPVVYGFLPDIEAHITADVRVVGHVVDVSGQANVPDGAVIAYSVIRPDRDDGTRVDGTATVRGGRFAFEADVSKLPPGRSAVWMGFGIGLGFEQPPNVVLTYGPYGERLAGDQLWSDSGDQQIELTVPIDIGP
jgi:hypothetical protein